MSIKLPPNPNHSVTPKALLDTLVRHREHRHDSLGVLLQDVQVLADELDRIFLTHESGRGNHWHRCFHRLQWQRGLGSIKLLQIIHDPHFGYKKKFKKQK